MKVPETKQKPTSANDHTMKNFQHLVQTVLHHSKSLLTSAHNDWQLFKKIPQRKFIWIIIDGDDRESVTRQKADNSAKYNTGSQCYNLLTNFRSYTL